MSDCSKIESDLKEVNAKFRSAKILQSDISNLRSRSAVHFIGGKMSTSKPQSINHDLLQNSRWVVIVAKPVPVWGLDSRRAVHIDNSPEIVSSRIGDWLRVRSIASTFDNDTAEAKCRTCHFLEFMIHLYVGPRDSTYIEVIRNQGCSLEYRTIRLALIAAAKGLDSSENFNRPNLKIPDDLLSTKYSALTIGDLENELDRCSDLLHSCDRNKVLFALENLAHMTNVDKVHTETAHNVSKLIMANTVDIRDLILAIFNSKNRKIHDLINAKICCACLSILAHSLTSLSKKCEHFDEDLNSFIEEVIPCLIDGVENIQCTHHASIALRCLCTLLRTSSLACSKANESKTIFNAVEQAVQIGRRDSFKLETTARITLDVLHSKLDTRV